MALRSTNRLTRVERQRGERVGHGKAAGRGEATVVIAEGSHGMYW